MVHNANRAAFHDPRFSPLRPAECDGLDIHISVLSPAEPFDFNDEVDLLDKLSPTVDGLIIADGNMRALFLPSVWQQLPTPDAFLDHLKIKAGMAPGHWSENFKAWRFIAAEVESPWENIAPS